MSELDMDVDVDMCDFKFSTEEFKKAMLKIQDSQVKRVQETLLKPFYMTGFKWPTEAETRVSSWRAMANYGISFVDPRRCVVSMKSVDDTPVRTPNKLLRIVFLVIFIFLFLLIWN